MQVIYKVIYHPLFNQIWRNLLKPLASTFPSISKLPVSGNIKLRLNNGKQFLVATNPTSFATKHLFWKGTETFEYVPIFNELIKRCNSFYDIGANTGLYTILANVQKTGIHVHAFEPSKGPFHYLDKNLKLNECINSRAHEIALSDAVGEVEFHEVVNYKYRFLPYNLGGVGNMAKKIPHRKMETTIVKTITVDAFWEENDGKTIDLVKIDTEATEDYVLRGMDKTIKNSEPIIICETLFNRIEDKVEDLMKQYPKYGFYNHLDGKLVKVESIRRTTDDGVSDCIQRLVSAQSQAMRST
jgi:FkbM family methyltransferase